MLFGRHASHASEARHPQLWEGLAFAYCPVLQSASGVTLYDLSGRNSHATVANASISSVWVRQGLDLDGADDAVTFSAIDLGTEHTLWCRLNLDTFNVFKNVLFGTSLSFIGWRDASANWYYSGAAPIVATGPAVGQWMDLAWRRRGTTVQMFWNGVSQGTNTTGAGNIVVNRFSGYSGGYPVDGRVAEIRGYRRYLSDGELRLLSSKLASLQAVSYLTCHRSIGSGASVRLRRQSSQLFTSGVIG